MPSSDVPARGRATRIQVRVGNWLFRWRNAIGPLLFLAALVAGTPAHPFGRPDANLAFDAAGVLIALAGLGLRIATIGFEYIERGGKNRQVHASRLVSGGVFAHCRNPLYLGNILICCGLALVIHSWLFYLIALPFIVLSYACMVAAEEEFLHRKFGAEYERYCASVRRWWPRWRGWKRSIGGFRFNWKRVVVKEYNTIFLLILALAGARLWSEYAVIGPSAAPPSGVIVASSLIWLIAYLLIRWTKKSGLIRP